jgi:hypothetical protein
VSDLRFEDAMRREIAQLWIRQLDGVGTPEVLVTQFSGGNCLCSTTWIYEGARRVKAPWGWPLAVRDADADGKPEFHGTQSTGENWGRRATRGSYAAVWNYTDGAVHDVTRAFPADIRADQGKQYTAYASDLRDELVGGARDAMLAYVLDGCLLGQGDAAMATLQSAVDAGKLDDPDSTISTADYMAEVRKVLATKAGCNPVASV